MGISLKTSIKASSKDTERFSFAENLGYMVYIQFIIDKLYGRGRGFPNLV